MSRATAATKQRKGRIKKRQRVNISRIIMTGLRAEKILGIVAHNNFELNSNCM